MQKTILITGSTDGIGLETAKALNSQGHHILLHRRDPSKLEGVKNILSALPNNGNVENYVADLSCMTDIETLVKAVTKKHTKLDTLINNAGAFRTPQAITQHGLDVRFAVNTIAPYLLTQRLMSLLGSSSRVINLSSAAQDSVNLESLTGQVKIADEFAAYAQSKLALTMWSMHMAHSLKENGPAVIAVNPRSMLGSKMVTEGFGVAGKDIAIGADILNRAATSEEFAEATGKYFDNDSSSFSSPHPDALDSEKCEKVVIAIEMVLHRLLE